MKRRSDPYSNFPDGVYYPTIQIKSKSNQLVHNRNASQYLRAIIQAKKNAA
jgi:ribosomal protein S30